MSRGQTLTLALAVGVLVFIVLGMVATATPTAEDVGPFPTGNGDDVEVTP